MISKSTYLKRHLTSGISDFTLSPPLNITAETFTTVTEFCYGRKIQLKPTNVAAVITAAELLGMKEGDINLRDVAESVFERIVCVEAVTVLRSCLSLFPEVETTSSIVSRCIETVILENEDMDEESVLDVIVEMEHRDFESVVYSLNGRLENHDVLYKLVDLYLKENKYDKLTDEQKTEICNSIDCTKLSPLILVDCVQNPIMPLRFIVRAILAEHLTTRRTITEAATTTAAGSFQQQVEVHRISLREFLQLDTTRRQNAQLKEAMNSTYSRIQTLEKELSCMKKILQDHQAEEEKEKEKEKAKEKELENSVLNSERSASFHVLPIDENSKIRRGGRGSVSSSGFVLDNMIKKNNEMVKYKYNVNSSEGSCHEGNDTQKRATSFRHRFITGLKNTFKIPNSSSNLKDHHQ
ncbi:BTB/POZ domain-containing protein [Trifolium pratense]|nr:BTB/POZ domain-containing protein [Trifolium pratense]